MKVKEKKKKMEREKKREREGGRKENILSNDA